tara:strand:- start:8134 stop:9036 length:903 start_codon:yes stop_codon:yes gene_type:complete
MDYVFVDDSCTPLGGTALTLNAIVEPFKERVEFVKTTDLTPQHLQFKNPKIWILGNITGLNQDSFTALGQIMQSRPFVKIDFDYGYCKYRAEVTHKHVTGSICDCTFSDDKQSTPLRTLYYLTREKALHIFYMSEEQRNFHLAKVIGIENSQKTSVLSSCFSSADIDLMENLRSNPKNGKYAIIDGQGGWHSQAKGVDEALSLASASGLEYELLKTDTHDEMLNLLSSFNGLIFLPLIHDTCPRVTIEAKLMGLQVITNSRSQHVYEDWWLNKSPEESQAYLEKRPRWFLDKLKGLHDEG